MAEGYEVGQAFVSILPDTDDFAEELEAKVQEATEGVEAKVKIGADDSELQAAIDDAKAKLDELDGREVKVILTADDSDLSSKTDEARAELDDLDGKEAKARLTLSKDDFDAEMDDAEARLSDMDGQDAEAHLGLDKDDFDAEMDDAEARLDEFEVRSASASLGASGGGAGGGGGGGEGGFGMPGGMMTYLATAAASLAPSFAGAATGLGLLGGTGALALGGVSKALEDADESTQNVGMTSQQVAAQQYSDSVQVQQAQQSVAEASEQSAQDQVSSANSIEEAQMNLTSVQQNAAESQVQALQSVQQAEQGVEEASFNLSEANYNLGQAYVTARDDIVNASNALADAKLNVQSATLAVAQAEQNQLLVDQNAYSTDIDRQQASLAVAQAKQQVKDATASETQAQQQSNLLNSQGVDGSQAVVQAKQAVTQAQYGMTNALASYQDAVRNLSLTEINNANQVKEAQLEVASAQEEAAYQQKMDAQSIADAERNLTQTVKEQQLEWASMLSTQNSAANQFAQEMAKLSPAGKSFVNAVLQLKGPFDSLEAVAQSGALPGMTKWLGGIKSLMPAISGAVKTTASQMGSAFASWGKILSSPMGAHVFDGLIANGEKFNSTVLPAFSGFITELSEVGSKKGAVDGLANALAGLMHGLSNLVRGLSPFTSALSSVWSTLGAAVSALGGPLGEVLGSLASALAPALKALLPAFTALASALGSGLSAAIQGVGPLLTALAQVIGTVVTALSPILPVAGELIAKLAQGLTPVVQALMPVIGTLAQVLAQVATNGLAPILEDVVTLLNPVAKLVIALAPLLTLTAEIAGSLLNLLMPVLDDLAQWLATGITDVINFATNWKQSWADVQQAATAAWNNVIGPTFRAIAGGAEWLYDNGIKPQFDLIKTVIGDLGSDATWLWHNSFDPMYNGILSGAKAFVKAFKTAWNDIESTFKTPVNFLISTVYDSGIRRFWNDVVGAVGLSSLDLKYVAPLAGGGVIPGYNPGHDTEPAMLSKGEAVLTPDATRAIGGKPAVDALNSAYPPSGGSGAMGGMAGKMAAKEVIRRTVEKPALKAATLGKFSAGGIVSDIWGGITGAASDVGHAAVSVAHGVEDAASIVAALATGNTAELASGLSHFVGTNASGNLARIMTGIPKTLATDLVNAITGSIGIGGGSGGPLPSGGSNSLGSLPENWHTIASYLYSHGASKFAAAGIAGNIEAESGGLPEQLEIGGGGGGGLIQWTPWQEYGPLITGNTSQDLMTQLAAILQFGGGLGLVNKATSPSNAAQIYQDYYERPESDTQSLATRMSSANAVYKAMGWGSFDQGGWMPPGAPNFTGQPEAVLTPEQSQAFVRFVDHLTTGQSGGAAGTGTPNVTVIYQGTQVPSVEQQAEMNRQLAMSLSGG